MSEPEQERSLRAVGYSCKRPLVHFADYRVVYIPFQYSLNPKQAGVARHEDFS